MGRTVDQDETGLNWVGWNVVTAISRSCFLARSEATEDFVGVKKGLGLRESDEGIRNCSKLRFSWTHFFEKMQESFCVFSTKCSVPRKSKNIFKKESQKFTQSSWAMNWNVKKSIFCYFLNYLR